MKFLSKEKFYNKQLDFNLFLFCPTTKLIFIAYIKQFYT